MKAGQYKIHSPNPVKILQSPRVPTEIVTGRMTLLMILLLVLINIFTTMSINIPKAEGLTGN